MGNQQAFDTAARRWDHNVNQDSWEMGLRRMRKPKSTSAVCPQQEKQLKAELSMAERAPEDGNSRRILTPYWLKIKANPDAKRVLTCLQIWTKTASILLQQKSKSLVEKLLERRLSIRMAMKRGTSKGPGRQPTKTPYNVMVWRAASSKQFADHTNEQYLVPLTVAT